MNTDSGEYNILINAVEKVINVDGMTCEIGVREGGSSKIILDTLKKTNQNKVHIAIDPFGNIDYEHWENRKDKLDYTNKMKNNMLKNLYSYCSLNNMECLYFPLEDTEFFKRFPDGIPIYNEKKYIINSYAMVFFDGPHTTELIKKEFDFFYNKIPNGGTIVFDDINQYPHMDNLDNYIKDKGFEILEKGEAKISYIKTKIDIEGRRAILDIHLINKNTDFEEIASYK
tara:strand:- start:3029 stop:3712 length:684 start_codon:yes stop_codon:yes gene_type:complete